MLIIVIYTHDPSDKTGFSRQYHCSMPARGPRISMMSGLLDLLGLISLRRVCCFCWCTLSGFAGVFDACTFIPVWSDGGPHHFKVSSTMVCFSQLGAKYKKQVEYNFFPPYYGHSVCDTVASHAKRKIKSKARELNLYLHQANEVCAFHESSRPITSLSWLDGQVHQQKQEHDDAYDEKRPDMVQ